MTTPSIITKARGALRLSREGTTPGERAAARATLDRILTKHGLTEADLAESPELEWRQFGYATRYEKRLLFQLVDLFTEGRETQYVQAGRRVEFRLTPDEYEDMTRFYDAYLPAWRELQDDTFYAFVLRNRIFVPGDVADEMDRDKAARVREIIMGLSRTSVPVSGKRRLK